jgi:predicted deacylase
VAIQIGSCEARPGEMTFGWLDALTHFDGTPERLPVVIAAGKHDGPCLWVTGTIHGNEYVGLLAAQGGVNKLVAPGDIVRPGDAVVELRDIWGRPTGEDGVLRTEKEGWVLNLRSGVAVYPNRPVMDLAARDDDPLVEPWPEKQ